jgi:hypothetical protein
VANWKRYVERSLQKTNKILFHKWTFAGFSLSNSGLNEVELPPRCHASVVTGSSAVCHCPICHSTLFSEPSSGKETRRTRIRNGDRKRGERIYRNWSQSTKF